MGLLLRSIWFLVVGWWLALIWIGLSVFLIGTIIFMPVGLYMLSKTWQIATFKRSPKTVYVEARQQTD